MDTSLTTYSYYCKTEDRLLEDSVPTGKTIVYCKNNRAHKISLIRKTPLIQLDCYQNIINNKLKNNLKSEDNPTVKNDSREGYSVGSVWFNMKLHLLFTCVCDLPNSAIWINTDRQKDLQQLKSLIPLNINSLTYTELPKVSITTKNLNSQIYTIMFNASAILSAGINRKVDFILNVGGINIIESSKSITLKNTSGTSSINMVFITEIPPNKEITVKAKVNGGSVNIKDATLIIYGC